MLQTAAWQLATKSKALLGLATSISPAVVINSSHGATAAITAIAVPCCVGYSLGSCILCAEHSGRRFATKPSGCPDPNHELIYVPQEQKCLSHEALDVQLPTVEPTTQLRRCLGKDNLCRDLTKHLSSTGSWEGVLQIVKDHHAVLNAINVSTALSGLAASQSRHKGPPSPLEKEGFRALEGCLAKTAMSMDPRSLCNSMQALTKLGSLRNPGLVEALVQRATDTAEGFRPRDIPAILSALLALGHPAPRLFASLEPEAVEKAEARLLRPRDLAQTASVFARWLSFGPASHSHRGKCRWATRRLERRAPGYFGLSP